MTCSTFYYSGLGACKAFREKVIGTIITNKGVTVAKSDISVLATWLAIIAGISSQTGIYVPFDRGYQNNTTEPEITTSNLGYSEKTFDFPPLIKGFGDMSYCDYKTFFAADNQDFDVFLVLKDGTIEGTEQTDGTIKGYRGKVMVMYNAPSADNLQESFPIDISFKDVNEWKQASYQAKTEFTITNLLDAVPAGLNIDVVTPYAGTDVTIKAVKRCQPDAPYADLVAVTNWPVLSSKTDLDVEVTAVDITGAAQGNYILTIEKDASGIPAALSDDVTIRAEDDDASNLTYVSQPELIAA